MWLLLTLLMLFGGALGVGFVSAIAGIGGGSLMVPFMVLLLGYNVRVAIATSLLCIVVTSSSAASIYLRRGLVDVSAALTLEPATAAGAITGAYVTLMLPPKLIRLALGALFLYVSLTMLRKALQVSALPPRTSQAISNGRKAAGIALSFVAGVTSGMFGIGGGVIKVPLMTMVLGMPIKAAVATSSFMVGLTAASGGAVYLVRGIADPIVVTALALGILPGATLGARCMRRVRPKYIRLTFSLILLYAAVRLIHSVL